MAKEIYWHLPGICYYGLVNHVLVDTMKKYPEMFYEGFKIGSVYGTFPGAIWNGGRSIMAGHTPRNEVEGIIKSYNKEGIPVRFTWTNVLIDESHVHDEYCNMIMEVGNNGLNQVLVNTEALENYIREKYPDYPIISSTTKRILGTDRLLEELNKDYFLVVLDYDLNHDEKVIEKILPVADRVEILVNETCQPHCPRRANHYREISKCTLGLSPASKLATVCTDRNPEARTFKGCMKRPQFMSNKDVQEYSEMGFENFKIVGRGLPHEFYIDSLVYYLVKPEHRDYIHRYLMDILTKLRAMQGKK